LTLFQLGSAPLHRLLNVYFAQIGWNNDAKEQRKPLAKGSHVGKRKRCANNRIASAAEGGDAPALA